MPNHIAQSIKLAAIGLTFLFGVGSLQAAAMPTSDFSFGALVSGTHSHSAFLPDTPPVNVLWFEFSLGTASSVTLDTVGSVEDTVLALYDSGGALLGQNDDLDFDNDIFTSFLSFGNLGVGSYLAGISETQWPSITPFLTAWEISATPAGGDNVTLNVTVSPVPVPAAVWLFGTALLGFVGMSRRTSIKS